MFNLHPYTDQGRSLGRVGTYRQTQGFQGEAKGTFFLTLKQNSFFLSGTSVQPPPPPLRGPAIKKRTFFLRLPLFCPKEILKIYPLLENLRLRPRFKKYTWNLTRIHGKHVWILGFLSLYQFSVEQLNNFFFYLVIIMALCKIVQQLNIVCCRGSIVLSQEIILFARRERVLLTIKKIYIIKFLF